MFINEGGTFMEIRAEYLRVQGLEIYCKRMGHGVPLLFLHGGPGDEHRYFLPHLLQLADRYELIFFDQPGCGQSQGYANQEDYIVVGHAHFLEALREKLGLKKMNLIGQSWGSYLALQYAVKYPDRVERLLLVSALGLTGQGLTLFEKRLLTNLQNRLSEREVIAASLMQVDAMVSDEARERFLYEYIFPSYMFNPDNLSKLTRTKVSMLVNRRLSQDVKLHLDLRAEAHVLQDIPIRVIQGAYDLITSSDLGEMFLPYISQVELITLERSGHWPFVEEPELFVAYTAGFFPVKTFS